VCNYNFVNQNIMNKGLNSLLLAGALVAGCESGAENIRPETEPTTTTRAEIATITTETRADFVASLPSLSTTPAAFKPTDLLSAPPLVEVSFDGIEIVLNSDPSESGDITFVPVEDEMLIDLPFEEDGGVLAYFEENPED
jgi:hypothetical protein